MEEEEGGMKTSFFGGVGVGVGRWKTLLLLAGGLLGCRIWGRVAECPKQEVGRGGLHSPPNSYRLGAKNIFLSPYTYIQAVK